MNKRNINLRFRELVIKIKSDEFYNNRGLANEVPFYIFDYQPEDELSMRDNIKNLLLPALKDDARLKAIEIDLFELLVKSLKNDEIFESVFKMEERRGQKFFMKNLKKVLIWKLYAIILKKNQRIKIL